MHRASATSPLIRRRALQALALLAILLPQIPVRGQGTRLQGFTENLAPLNYQDEGTGLPQGFSVELLRLLADEARLPCDIEVMPWQRAVQTAAQTPLSLLFSLTRTPERETQYQWLGPISPRRILVYRLGSRADVRPASLQQLKGLKLGVVRDSATATQLLAEGLRADAEIEWARDDASNIRKLLAGRMELLVMLDWAAAWHLRQLKLPYATLSPVMAHDVSKTYWYGLPPDTDPALLKRLQGALDKLKRDGRYEHLRQRYFA
jgi:polar amino acid transport system substrate-binding protein